MPAHVLALYNPPADPAAFDHHYASTHIPIAKKLPGLTGYSVSRAVVMPDGSTAPYHLVADLTFGSMEALNGAFQSPEGAAAIADLPNFAGAGVTIVTYESVEV